MTTRFALFWLMFGLLSIPPVLANAETREGHFIDAPVTGLFYKTTSGLSGTTHQGKFSYRPGDIIYFYLGQDDNGYLLSTLSGQEVITPTQASTQVNRSINMTRLLLTLDATPQNNAKIKLLSDALTDKKFLQQLKQIDLSFIDEHLDELDLPLVSAREAIEHLTQSQQYITDNFTSDQIVYRPLGVQFESTLVPKKDWQGKICAYNLDRANHPNYHRPVGIVRFAVRGNTLIEYPALGDFFNGCQLRPEHGLRQMQSTPLDDFSFKGGLIGCAQHGCTRNDLNGFYIEDFDDDGDWKYRTIAMNFDPTTQLYMEKAQGLGHTSNVRHSNRSEMMWFTYPTGKGDHIPYQGIWLRTRYLASGMAHQCLKVGPHAVLRGPTGTTQCPEQPSAYSQDVTTEYKDMWWLNTNASALTLADLNLTVTWFDPQRGPQYTSWEYLPAGAQWDQGILYRYQQRKHRAMDGQESMQTLSVDEFTRQHKDSQ